MAYLILKAIAIFILVIALAIVFIYLRYKFFQWRQRQMFYAQAQTILQQRGQFLTRDHKRAINKMLLNGERSPQINMQVFPTGENPFTAIE